MAKAKKEKLFLPGFFAPFAEKIKGKKLYCSFSGGGDSLALLLLLLYGQKEYFYTLYAVHFEHGFRGEASLKDGEFCRKKCEEKNIPFQMICLNVPANRRAGEGEEEAARRLRLAAWKKIISDPENEYIVTGHHAGDVAENILLRLFRGGNSSSLTSLRTFFTVKKMQFFRPLLSCTKKDLEEFLHSQNELSWCLDSTNKEDFYRRNFLRNRILPDVYKTFPFAEKGIGSAAKALACDAAYIEEESEKAFALFRKNNFSLELLYSLHDALLIRVLRYFLREHSGEEIIPDGAMLQRVKLALEQYRKRQKEHNGEALYLPIGGTEEKFFLFANGQLQCVKKENSGKGKLLLCNENDLLKQKKIIFREKNFVIVLELSGGTALTNEKNVFYFDCRNLVFPLYVSLWQGGEKMIPFGRSTPVLLKKLFSDAKIPSWKRGDHPLISDGNENILCAGTLRRSATAPVSESSSLLLKITLSDPEKFV